MSDPDDLDPIDEGMLERALSEALTSESADPVAYADLVSYIQGTADAQISARIQGLLADSADLRERVILLSEALERFGQMDVGSPSAKPGSDSAAIGRIAVGPARYRRLPLGLAASFFLGAILLAVGGYRWLVTSQGAGLPSPSNGPAPQALALAPAIRELEGGRLLRGAGHGEQLKPAVLQLTHSDRSILLVLKADVDDTYKDASLHIAMSESGVSLWSTTRRVHEMVSNGDVLLLVDTLHMRDGQEYTVTVVCVAPGSALDGTDLFSRSFRILRK